MSNRFLSVSVVLVAGVVAALVPGMAQAATAERGETAVVKTTSYLRALPTSQSSADMVLSAGDSLYITCWTRGEPTYGTDRYGSMWLEAMYTPTEASGWVHSFLVTPVDVPAC